MKKITSLSLLILLTFFISGCTKSRKEICIDKLASPKVQYNPLDSGGGFYRYNGTNYETKQDVLDACIKGY